MREYPQFMYDLSDAPLVRLTYPETVQEWMVPDAFELFVTVAQEFGKVAWVIDFRGFNPLTARPKIRRAFSDHFTKNRSILESATVAEAMVSESDVFRGVVTAINWLNQRKMNTRLFSNLNDAESWAKSRMEAHGLAPVVQQLQNVQRRLEKLNGLVSSTSPQD